MKVVIVNNLYAPNIRGGAERSVQLLAEALVAMGVQVSVVCTAEKSGDTVDLNGVKVITLAVGNLHWPFGRTSAPRLQRQLWHVIDTYNRLMQGRIGRVLEAEKPDVVHTNNLQGISIAAWRAAKRRAVPVVHTLRDYYLVCARASCFRNGQNCSRTCLECLPFHTARRFASRWVDAVVGTSRFILERHTQVGFFSDASLRTVIVNSAVACERSRAPRRRVVFGFLGRFEPSKGIERLLRAFADRDDDDWELLIAGVGSVAEQLRCQAAGARRPERISFPGWIDAEEFLRRVDVVVVPSLWHAPLSRSAIEAQVNGLPVVASRRGGLPEIVSDGSTGLLFDPDEPEALARVIDQLLRQRHLIDQLGDAARKEAHRFRPDRVAARYVETYTTAIGVSAR